MKLSSSVKQVNAPAKGILYMLAGIFFIVCLDATVKWLSPRYSIFQILFFRNAVAIFLFLFVILVRHEMVLLKSQRKGWHLLRSILSLGINLGFFYALANMPIANVLAVSFFAPSLVTIMSMFFLKEKVDISQWVAILVSLAGVMMILRPSPETFDLAALAILGATILYAIVSVTSRFLSDGESGIALTFYLMPVSMLVATISLPSVWVMPTLIDWVGFMMTGVCGLLGFWGMTEAFRYAPASTVTPFEYTSILWAILFGFAFWGEVPDVYALSGAALIVISSLFIGLRKRFVPATAETNDMV